MLTAPGFIAGSGQSQRPQRAGLDQAAGTVLGDRRGVQPVQQCQRLPGAVLGEQDPGQHQVPRLARVVLVVVRSEAGFFGPAGGCYEVTLGQQQPRPLCRDRVEQPGWPGRGLPGLADSCQGPAGSPVACRIQASVTRPAASGGV